MALKANPRKGLEYIISDNVEQDLHKLIDALYLLMGLDKHSGYEIIINGSIIPKQDEISLKPYKGAANYMKRGPKLYLGGYDRNKILDKRLTITELVKEKSFRSRLRLFTGYSFYGNRPQEPTLVTLVDCIEGYLLYKKIITNEDLLNSVKLHIYRPLRNIDQTSGYKAIVDGIPSRSSTQHRYHITLHSIPFNLLNPEHYYTAFCIKSDHTCGFKNAYTVTFGRFTKPNIFCAHDIAAYLFIAHYNQIDNKAPLVLSPFLIPTNRTLELYEKLNSIVSIIPTNIRNTKAKSKTKSKTKSKRPLNKTEKELLLWLLTLDATKTGNFYKLWKKQSEFN